MAAPTPTSSPLHTLLLLSDSALPLGSFAFSSGLESFLAHTKCQTPDSTKSQTNFPFPLFSQFLHHSLGNLASTALPYVLAAYHGPERLRELDNDFDAATPCTVARRASVTQGRALVGVWERALYSSAPAESLAARTLSDFAAGLKVNSTAIDGFGLLDLNAHFPPLFGTTCRALGLTEADTGYVFLLNHAKAVLSAAVRASVMGPYQSHAVLAGEKLQEWVRECVAREGGMGREEVGVVGMGEGDDGWRMRVQEAAVTVPVMDLWMGRHELLYSRIFNS